MARVQGDVSDSGGLDRTKGIVEGLLVNSYRSMAVGEDGPAAGFRLLAQRVWTAYQSGLPEERLSAIGLPAFADMDREVRKRMLDPEAGEPPEVRAILRAKLGEPPEASAPPADTNAPPVKASSP